MAIYHLNASTGTRNNNKSAGAKYDYIMREGKYAKDRFKNDRTSEVEVTLSGNMPTWAQGNEREYWRAADKYERANGRLFKEIEFALPIELSPKERLAAAKEFADIIAGGENMPYTLSIHIDNEDNPHCHLMVSERMNDNIPRPPELWFGRANKGNPIMGGAEKSTSLKPREWLYGTRALWATVANQYLGADKQIDHRSLRDQGIFDREPTWHIGFGQNKEIFRQLNAVNNNIKTYVNAYAEADYQENIEHIATTIEDWQLRGKAEQWDAAWLEAEAKAEAAEARAKAARQEEIDAQARAAEVQAQIAASQERAKALAEEEARIRAETEAHIAARERLAAEAEARAEAEQREAEERAQKVRDAEAEARQCEVARQREAAEKISVAAAPIRPPIGEPAAGGLQIETTITPATPTVLDIPINDRGNVATADEPPDLDPIAEIRKKAASGKRLLYAENQLLAEHEQRQQQDNARLLDIKQAVEAKQAEHDELDRRIAAPIRPPTPEAPQAEKPAPDATFNIFASARAAADRQREAAAKREAEVRTEATRQPERQPLPEASAPRTPRTVPKIPLVMADAQIGDAITFTPHDRTQMPITGVLYGIDAQKGLVQLRKDKYIIPINANMGTFAIERIRQQMREYTDHARQRAEAQKEQNRLESKRKGGAGGGHGDR